MSEADNAIVDDDARFWPPEQPGREPPWSPEAEHSVLGSLLLDNGMLAMVGDLLSPQSFYVLKHRHIYAAIADLVGRRVEADVITTHQRIREMAGDAVEVTLAYLNALATGVLSPRNARRYAEIVMERHHDRMLIAACDEALRTAWNCGSDLSDRIDSINAAVMRVEQARKSPGRRVPLLKLEALRAQSAEVGWMVKHVVPSDSVGMLYGGSGTFKSFIALDCALHVAHGLPWMGRKTVEGAVLYIAAEGGSGLWARIDAWHRARRLEWQDVPVHVVPIAVDLRVDAWRIVDAAQACGVTPQLVVVDTLSQTYSGEENSANEMAAYLRELGIRFRAMWGCAVMLIHHTGHQATERPRGSSAIRANLDWMLSVFRDEKEMLATLSAVKQKDGELFPDATFSMSVQELGVDADNDPITSLVARHLGTVEEVAQARAREAEAGRGGRNYQLMSLVQNGMEEKRLRSEFYKLLEGLEPEAKKKAYQRARARAIESGEVDIGQGIVIDRRRGA